MTTVESKLATAAAHHFLLMLILDDDFVSFRVTEIWVTPRWFCGSFFFLLILSITVHIVESCGMITVGVRVINKDVHFVISLLEAGAVVFI